MSKSKLTEEINPGDPEAQAEWRDPYGFQSHGCATRYIHWLENELQIRSKQIMYRDQAIRELESQIRYLAGWKGGHD